MEIKIIKDIKIVLELNQEEANWLKGIMQNPINVESLIDEPKRDAEMRKNFFTYLSRIKDL